MPAPRWRHAGRISHRLDRRGYRVGRNCDSCGGAGSSPDLEARRVARRGDPHARSSIRQSWPHAIAILMAIGPASPASWRSYRPLAGLPASIRRRRWRRPSNLSRIRAASDHRGRSPFEAGEIGACSPAPLRVWSRRAHGAAAQARDQGGTELIHRLVHNCFQAPDRQSRLEFWAGVPRSPAASTTPPRGSTRFLRPATSPSVTGRFLFRLCASATTEKATSATSIPTKGLPTEHALEYLIGVE